jgi:hypothetical protein
MRWSRIVRVWLPDWLRDGEKEIQRILGILDALIESDSSTTTGSEHRSTRTPDTDASQNPPVAETDLRGAGVAASGWWKPWQVRRLGDPVVLQNVRYMENLRVVHGYLREIVSVEGPVSPRRLVSLIADAYGVDLVSEKLHDEVLGIQIAGVTRDSEGFLYPPEISPEQYQTWRKTAAGDRSKRAVEDISWIELRNGVLAQLSVTQSANLEQILIGMRTDLGAEFLTERIATRILDIVRESVTNGRLVLSEDESYTLPNAESAAM